MNDLLDGIITNLIVKFFLRFIAPYPIQLILGIMAIYWGYYTYYVKQASKIALETNTAKGTTAKGNAVKAH